MSYDFKLPDIGEGLHEAELIEWTVQVGDTVAEGDEVASVSTDKVNVELPAPYAGTITELCWKPGDIVTVGEVLLRMEREGAGGIEDAGEPEPAEETGQVRKSAPVAAAATIAVKASPKIRKEAKRRGIDLSTVTPSGDRGQVVMKDLDAAEAGDTRGADQGAGGEVFALRGARAAAADRMETSSRTLATTNMTFRCNGDAILAAAEALGVSPLAVIAVRVARALRDNPRFNGSVIEEDRALRLSEAIHLGLATDTADGLIVPVIRDFAALDPEQAAAAIATAAKKARSGTLKPADVQGATFTLSSTGGLETAPIIATAPVINYPNVATLWVSRITDQPRVHEGELEAGPVMHCTLAFDHRFLHGADALKFIGDLDAAFSVV